MSSSSELKVFASPERYVQGRNATAQLGEQMKKVGLEGPVLVVSSMTPKILLQSVWSESLSESGYKFHYLPFGGNCTADEALKIAASAEAHGVKTIVAFGGGQVIDCVRSASCLDSDHVYDFVSCPTIASTDAPCSTLCVMYNNQDHSFEEYRYTRRHPVLVLVDTVVVAQAPKRMLVGGIGDALATYFEARSIKEAGSTNFLGAKPTESSMALCKLCCDILMKDSVAAVQAVETSAVTPALERVVEANTLLSGLGFESGGLYIAHSVHNGLTSQSTHTLYTHGEKVAFGLLTQLIVEGRPTEEINDILRLCDSVGLPITLKEVGVDVSNQQSIQEIAARALADGESSHKGVLKISVDMMADGIRAADHCGQEFKKSLLEKCT